MSFSKQLKLLLHPYLFVLKEGKEFKKNSMSYDLMMLQISNETIKSPPVNLEEDLASELEVLKAAIPKALARMTGLEAGS